MSDIREKANVCIVEKARWTAADIRTLLSNEELIAEFNDKTDWFAYNGEINKLLAERPDDPFVVFTVKDAETDKAFLVSIENMMFKFKITAELADHLIRGMIDYIRHEKNEEKVTADRFHEICDELLAEHS